MTGVWFAVRSTLRRRWLSYLVLVVLLAFGGGASLAAVAGARRTVSAYPRYLRESNASDVSVDAPELGTASIRDRIAHVPGVIRAASYQAFYAAPLGPDDRADPKFTAEAIGSIDGRFFDQDRVAIVDGRLADPTRAGELVINRVAAQQYHYKVGQRMRFGVTSEEHLNADYENPPLDAIQPMRIVGIAKFNDEIVQDEIDRSPSVLLTPAFVRANAELGTYVWTGLRVRGGKRAVSGVLKAVEQAGVKVPFVRVASDTTERAQRAVRPLAWSLALFGIAAGLAVVVLAGQGLVRQVRLSADDQPVLRAIGMQPAGIATVGMAGGIAAAALGVVGAVGVAVALSPLSPVGPVRVVEPSPGVAFDALVLGLGAALILALVVVQPIITAWRLSRVEARSREPRPSRAVAALAKSGAPVSAVAGARFALEPGRGRTSVPIRTTLVSAVIAMMALTAALTWGASLRSLVNEPRHYGWDWDATFVVGGGYGPDSRDAMKSLQALLDKDPAVRDWAGMAFQSVTLDGKSVAVIGLARGKGEVGPPVVDGARLGARNEILLGSRTLSELDRRVGEQITLGKGGHHQALRITGQAVFPTIGVLHGDRASLGSGALVDRSVLQAAPDDIGAIIVRFKPGADRAAALRRLRGYGQDPKLASDPVFTGPKRPADIVNFRDMGAAPTVMATLFGLVALGALANALVASVRRRRRELALLKALGMTRRQVSQAVAWQATITIAIAMLVGVPVGIAIGRSLWTKFADSVGVVPAPTVPFVSLLFVVVGGLAVANLIAAVPGRTGSRTEAAVALRSE